MEPQRGSEADQEAPAVTPAPVADPGQGSGGGGDEGSRAGAKGAPLPVEGATRAGSGAGDEEVRGTVIGAPEGTGGKLAFGAPGLKGAGDEGGGLGAAIAIGVAALLAALLGIGWEQRRGRLA